MICFSEAIFTGLHASSSRLDHSPSIKYPDITKVSVTNGIVRDVRLACNILQCDVGCRIFSVLLAADASGL